MGLVHSCILGLLSEEDVTQQDSMKVMLSSFKVIVRGGIVMICFLLIISGMRGVHVPRISYYIRLDHELVSSQK
jgi:hypothetical protein